jgi:hypothetical protein
MLYDTALVLQQTGFAETEDAETALEKVKIVVDVFESHAAHEGKFVLPAIQRYEPSIVDLFGQEQEKERALSQGLLGLIMVYRHAIKAGVKIETGQAINRAFIEFMIFSLEHMAKEETVLNKILWRYYSDAELEAISYEVVASLSPTELELSSAWLMRGLSTTEICTWLKSVEKNAAHMLFMQLFNLAEKELPAQRFRHVQENLSEGMMVAL